MLSDSPGLADKNLPTAQWLEIYNGTFKQQFNAVDLVLIIIEKRERVSAAETIAFTVLDEAVEKMDAKNLAVVMNKCGEDDELEDALEFYNQARA